MVEDLLYERIKQLRDIDERLERIDVSNPDHAARLVRELRDDLARWIDRAEQEYRAF